MRIQILTLPSVAIGDIVEEPFALVVDQWRSPLPSEEFMAGWYKFRDECGAKAVFVTEDTVEVVDRYAEPDTDVGDVTSGWPKLDRPAREPIAYTVVQMLRGAPLAAKCLETREAALARQKTMDERDPFGLAAPWITCKVVPLDEQERRSP